MYSAGYPCQILIKAAFSPQIFKKKPQVSNFMTVIQSGAQLFDADGRTEGKWKAKQAEQAR